MKPLASLGFAAAFLPGGCSPAEFYWQGITGQIDLLVRAESIPSVLDKIRDPIVKRKLERVLAIRDYASRELGLPQNASYRRYTELDRRFVLWNVFATPELSLTPRRWWFPIAGCGMYRGCLAEASARAGATRRARPAADV